MKILFLAPQPFYENRGTPIAVRACLEGLARLGHSVDVVCYFGGQDVPLPSTVTLHRIPRPAMVRQVPIGVSWQKLPCDWAMYRQARAMLDRGGYDVIHAVEESAFLARRLWRRTGVPYVFDMDSLMSSQIVEKSRLLWPVSKVFGRLEHDAIRDSAGVLAVCPMLVAEAGKHHPRARVALLPDLPVEPSPASQSADPQLPEPIGGDARTLRLTYVGNLESYQGIDLLLDAWRLLAADRPNAEVLIIGGSSGHLEAYRAKAGGLAGVRLLGPRPLELLPAILRASDVLLSPRIKGINTPMKIYNYMQAGRAIVATRLPTHTQVLDDATACLVEPTASGLASGLARVVADGDYRRRLGEAARDLVDREYSAARWHERLSDFYQSLDLRRSRP